MSDEAKEQYDSGDRRRTGEPIPPGRAVDQDELKLAVRDIDRHIAVGSSLNWRTPSVNGCLPTGKPVDANANGATTRGASGGDALVIDG